MISTCTAYLIRRLSCWIVVVLCCAGCRTFISPVQHHPRSLEQLYEEAMLARHTYPENSTTPHDEALPPLTVPLEPQLHPGTPYLVPTAHAQPTIERVNATVVQSQPRVSDIFEDTDVRQAIQSLATQAGVSVIIDEEVGGVTTAFIENESFEQALKKVLLPLGLISRYKDGQYLIGTTNPESALFPELAETLEYRPEHLSPDELVSMLGEREQQYIRVIPKRNVMVVHAPYEMSQQIYSRLYAADEPIPQVVLEVIVCVFSPEQKFQFNMDGEHGVKVNGDEVMKLGLQGLAFTGLGAPVGSSGVMTDFAFTSTFLRLLAQEGYVTIRAAPRVMAKDGEKATISIARQTFFSTTPERADIVFSQNIQQVEAGISLDIVPIIRGDNVTINIERAEVSENITNSDTSENLISPYPLINRRQVSTTVHVKDGHTIVIGGLVQRQTIDRVSRIPYLGDVPWLGKAFHRIQQEDLEAEVAIFISPKIIRAPDRRTPLCLEATRESMSPAHAPPAVLEPLQSQPSPILPIPSNEQPPADKPAETAEKPSTWDLDQPNTDNGAAKPSSQTPRMKMLVVPKIIEQAPTDNF